jgi:hypothetical protein
MVLAKVAWVALVLALVGLFHHLIRIQVHIDQIERLESHYRLPT